MAAAFNASNRPQIGVGVVIHDGNGNIMVGERVSSHGTGTLQCPGGHLEYGESFAATAAREVREETGLTVGHIHFLAATNDVFEDEGKHYVTVFVTGIITGKDRVARAMEHHKCAQWEWVPWKQVWAWSKDQGIAMKEGREVQRNMFLPLVNLVKDYPELENHFDEVGKNVGKKDEREEKLIERIDTLY